MARQNDRQTGKTTDIIMDRQTDKMIDIQSERQANRTMVRQNDRQADRQMDGLMDGWNISISIQLRVGEASSFQIKVCDFF